MRAGIAFCKLRTNGLNEVNEGLAPPSLLRQPREPSDLIHTAKLNETV